MTSLLPDTSPRGVRERIRRGEWTRPTAGLSPGHVQANLVSLPREQAFDFLLFCQRNPRPCPLVEVLEPGSPEPTATAPGADIRTDLPAYNVYREGVLEATVADVRDYWRDDLVTFLLGCSFTFETALASAGIPLHHVESDRNVAMYKTNVATMPAGVFAGPLVVSMRPVPQAQVVKAVQVTSRFPNAHGARRCTSATQRRWASSTSHRPTTATRPRHPRWRDPAVLGVRGDAAGRGGGVQAPLHDHPRPRAHVHHGPAGRGCGGALTACLR